MSSQPFTFEALEGEARLTLRNSAASRAEELIAAARAEAAQIEEASRELGFAEGRAAGLASVLEELDPIRQTLESIARELVAHHEELVAQAEKTSVELALALADKVLGTALEIRPELVLSVVTGALRRVADRNSVVIEVNPADIELVREAIDGIAAGFGGFASLEVVAERRVGRGGCTVRLNEGEIGACIDEQLSRAAEIVRDVLRG